MPTLLEKERRLDMNIDQDNINQKDLNGLRQGKWIIDLAFELIYVDDKINGLWKYWGDSQMSRLYSIGFCVNGIKEGEEIMYEY